MRDGEYLPASRISPRHEQYPISGLSARIRWTIWPVGGPTFAAQFTMRVHSRCAW
jgi:hypothetical protein